MQENYEAILKKCTVLIADDDEAFRKKFKSVLLTFVEHVYEASDGDIALENFKKNRPNIVFLDLRMPAMDGLMLTALLRKIDDEVPLVVLSAYNKKKDLHQLISKKLVDYVLKPVNYEQLKAVLQRCAAILEKQGMVEYVLSPQRLYSFSKKALIIQGEELSLSAKEIALLELLIKHKNKLITKEQIEEAVYAPDDMSDAALNNLILRVRKKIGVKQVIASVSHLGFMLVSQKPLEEDVEK